MSLKQTIQRNNENPTNLTKISYHKNLYKEDISFTDDLSIPLTKPFSRKPFNQSSQPILPTFNDSHMEDSIETSIIDTQSVTSDKKLSGAKFVRTSKVGLLSPKSRRNDSVGKSSLNNSQYGTQSMFLTVESRLF